MFRCKFPIDTCHRAMRYLLCQSFSHLEVLMKHFVKTHVVEAFYFALIVVAVALWAVAIVMI